MSSDVRVFVHWKNRTVFSGEDLECKIVFKNVSTPPESLSASAANNKRQQIICPSHTTVSSAKTPALPNSKLSRPRAQGHRPTVSLDVPFSPDKAREPGSWTDHQHGIPAYGQKHRRSVSIISLGRGIGVEREGVHHQSSGQISIARRPVRYHTRSASLQVLPRWSAGTDAGPSSAPLNTHAGLYSSPLINPSMSPSASEPNPSQSLPFRHIRRLSGTVSAPYSPGRPIYPRQPSGSITPNIRVPCTSPKTDVPPLSEAQYPAELAVTQPKVSHLSKAQAPEHPDNGPSATEHLHPVTKVLSGSSMNGTPRSSLEFYSMSNNSTETLASECAPQGPHRFNKEPTSSRQRPQPAPVLASRRTLEALMMGYAQVVGSFTLDGSFVNQAPFEEVKRKGILGGQGGGGVVGVEKSKGSSGLFGALGWGSIGESIGGLLGDRELSSIKEMREIANSRSVPLLSTPKSVLFVDLQLAPGESKSYTYSFTLPRGLPPSHKGKSIKISYQLVLGTQRANTLDGQQSVRHVNIPFRVLSSVNGEGEILGHDLMSPHVPLRDKARVRCLEDSVTSKTDRGTSVDTKAPDSSLQGFLSYVDSILERPRQHSSFGLLSPTASRGTQHFSRIEGPASVREAIDLAILRSNVATSSNRSTNRFEIARNGQRVAVIMLTRSAYRLGETITAAIDLSVADIPCYSIYGTLETSENVDPAIALRSGTSIHRFTRRIHASHAENTLFARKAIFSPTIPATATPGFVTSGVSLEWSLRIGFVTPRSIVEDEKFAANDALLEEVSQDDRGSVMAAAESLACESFEITVPLRVYGAVAAWSESNEVEGLPI